MDTECVLTYCDNATSTPINDETNYVKVTRRSDASYDLEYGSTEKFERYIKYVCKSGTKLQNETATKDEASDHARAYCQSSGEWAYPTTWPACVETITCADPGTTDQLVRTEKKLTGKDLSI